MRLPLRPHTAAAREPGPRGGSRLLPIRKSSGENPACSTCAVASIWQTYSDHNHPMVPAMVVVVAFPLLHPPAPLTNNVARAAVAEAVVAPRCNITDNGAGG